MAKPPKKPRPPKAPNPAAPLADAALGNAVESGREQERAR